METNYDALIQTSADELFQRMSSGDEVIGFRNQDGDSLVAVSFDEDLSLSGQDQCARYRPISSFERSCGVHHGKAPSVYDKSSNGDCGQHRCVYH